MTMKRPSNLDEVLALPPALNDGLPSAPRRPTKAGGRFEVLNGFVDCELAKCTRAEVAAWLVLFRDSREGKARTGQTWIAKRAGLNARSVGRALHALKERGLVEVLKMGGPNAGANLYRVHGAPRKGGNHAR